ncbi:MAG: discoidin domain-containing protein [Phycisphaerae bacterium]|nr:discoidin domain-containing protein [Phycisphaerae bacterium]
MSRMRVYLTTTVLALGLASTSLADGLDPNLIGWWRFDEGTGTTAADSGVNGLDGALVNGPVWRADGLRNGCLFFDGYDDYVQVAQDVRLNPGTGSFTVVLWANVDATAGTRGDANWDLAVAKRDSGSAGYYVGADRNQGASTETGWRFMLGNTAAARTDTPYVPAPLGEWVFVAAVLDRAQNVQKISVDGGLTWATQTPPTGSIAPARDLGIGWDIGQNNYWFRGRIDEVALFSRALSDAQILLILQEGMTPALAKDPQPRNGATDVLRDVTLGWTPGLYAETHDLYFSMNLADVETATRANPLGILYGQDMDNPEFDLRLLDYGQTYYWRIDEVNGAPDHTVFQGEIWHFETEPRAYPLAGAQITATASSANTLAETAANTIDGSGLSPDDQHSTDTADMWLSGVIGDGQSAWIQYEFDKVYAIHQMLVWNHNSEIEAMAGLGIKEATVAYSLDGVTWVDLAGNQEFAKATGKADYAANTTVPFGDVAAKYVRITAVSNWAGIFKQYGLSEVRFLYTPMAARQPDPESGAVDLDAGLTLTWRPGRQAVEHRVFLSTDEQAVLDGTAPFVTVSEPSLSTDTLNLGQTYYWRVDEVNNAAPVPVWEGEVWSFTTLQYVVVDDFESYTDVEGGTIYQTWVDGWENGTCSQVGHWDPPFAEQAIIHGGRQSMPLSYGNTKSPYYSEAVRSFADSQDWTEYGIGTLTLYFRGAMDNTGQLYVKINDTKVPYDGNDADIASLVWLAWNIDLSTVNADLEEVEEMTIGIEGSGAEGILYLDDIRLYPAAPDSGTSAEPNRANLIAHYTLNGNVADSSGSGHDGVLNGDAVYTAGIRGQAVEFDGFDDHVRIADDASLNPGTGNFSISFWARLDTTPGASGTTNWDLAVAKRTVGSNGYYVGADRNQGTADQAGYKFMLGDTTPKRVDTPFVLVPLGEWVFVAAVLDRDQNLHKISVDTGQTWLTSTPPAGTIAPAKDLAIGWDIGQNNYWFHGTIDEVRIYNLALTNDEVLWLANH